MSKAASDTILELISAIAAGEADRGEVAAKLRNDGITSLDVLLDLLAEATPQGRLYSDLGPAGPSAHPP